MNFYTQQHRYYCGIDLHARSMYVCILDAAGTIVVHKNMAAAPDDFLRVVTPYRDDLVVAVECIFTWYCLADLCARESIPFVLGHALYMKAIHGGKAKNDKIDAHKIAVLLRGGMLPRAYVYPAAMRATRDLLRRRCHLVRKRVDLVPKAIEVQHKPRAAGDTHAAVCFGQRNCVAVVATQFIHLEAPRLRVDNAVVGHGGPCVVGELINRQGPKALREIITKRTGQCARHAAHEVLSSDLMSFSNCCTESASVPW